MKNKACSTCGKRKPTPQFYKDKKSKHGLSSRCMGCARETSKQWRSSHREEHRAYSSAWQKENAEHVKKRERTKREMYCEIICQYLEKQHCIVCGEEDILVLDFDHLRDKKFSVSHAYDRHVSMEELLEEIEKCQVLCSNCHRRKTAEQTNSLRWQYVVRKTNST